MPVKDQELRDAGLIAWLKKADEPGWGLMLLGPREIGDFARARVFGRWGNVDAQRESFRAGEHVFTYAAFVHGCRLIAVGRRDAGSAGRAGNARTRRRNGGRRQGR